jgi:hypothetical protein
MLQIPAFRMRARLGDQPKPALAQMKMGLWISRSHDMAADRYDFRRRIFVRDANALWSTGEVLTSAPAVQVQ